MDDKSARKDAMYIYQIPQTSDRPHLSLRPVSWGSRGALYAEEH